MLTSPIGQFADSDETLLQVTSVSVQMPRSPDPVGRRRRSGDRDSVPALIPE